ncbi:MAG: OstA-like protein [Bacteroidota bacterium]|nr:OstA-like protein [Bacteroidota bacterium]
MIVSIQKADYYRIFFLLIIGISFCISGIAQESTAIEIIHADKLLGTKKAGKTIRRLIGNVELMHDSVHMYCDSAYHYLSENYFTAYSNVRMVQGDTLFLYGDSLRFNGENSEGEVRGNVKLLDNNMQLTTNFLDFNTETNKSHYFNGGTVVDSANTLFSNSGYYYSDVHEFHFNDSVVLVNPDYSIFTDTLKYNTNTEKTFFFGPTDIISDSNYIYCENGWYDTHFDIARFGKNTLMIRNEYIIEADSLYYNNNSGIGIARKNVVIEDTIQNIWIKGHYAFLDQKKDYSYVTDSAVFIQFQDNDSLYLHADTLFSTRDSLGKKLIKAFYGVKFFRYEMQGKCDSLVYSEGDSLIKLYERPIIWNEQNQITAEYIQIHSTDGKADRIDIQNSAFIITLQDSTKYNQIFGKNMTGYISNNELHKIDVYGNAQTIYYPMDGENYIGANMAEASNMTIHLKDGAVRKIVWYNMPEGVMKPLNKVTQEELHLRGFQWLAKERPMNKYDIFISSPISYPTKKQESR